MPPPSKKRKTDSATAEIVFDPSLRSDYLTGFHRRKQARIKAAQEKAIARDREQKIKSRAEARQRRKEELEAHVEAVNEATQALNGHLDSDIENASDGGEIDGEKEWSGFSSPPPQERINREEEYIDEEKFTTVTVSEVGISRTGFVDVESEDENDHENEPTNGENTQPSKPEAIGASKEKKPQKKKKSFRYETKEERKITRRKERRKNSTQAKLRKTKK